MKVKKNLYFLALSLVFNFNDKKNANWVNMYTKRNHNKTVCVHDDNKNYFTFVGQKALNIFTKICLRF